MICDRLIRGSAGDRRSCIRGRQVAQSFLQSRRVSPSARSHCLYDEIRPAVMQPAKSTSPWRHPRTTVWRKLQAGLQQIKSLHHSASASSEIRDCPRTPPSVLATVRPSDLHVAGFADQMDQQARVIALLEPLAQVSTARKPSPDDFHQRP